MRNLKNRLLYIRRTNSSIYMLMVAISCLIIILIKYTFAPLRVYDKIIYLEATAQDGITYGLYDCRVEHYLSGKVVIYHDCGEMQINDINNIKFYDIGEIK